ncbi:MAG: hypothetical protein HYX53_15475 [Chloroflexi bacterium]|nr:hypothetical protein [Chloroflexota bacterium]
MFTRARMLLAAWFAGALAVTIIAIGAVVYAVVRNNLDQQLDDSIRASNAELQAGAKMPPKGPPPGGGPGPSDGDGDDYSRRLAGISSDIFYVITAADGTIQGNPRNVDTAGIDFAELASAAGSGQYWGDISSGGTRYRVTTSPWSGTAGGYLTVGRSLESRDQQLRSLLLVLVIGGLSGVVLSGAGGLWLAGRALVPIRRSLDTQRRFVSDASHELRTPLAVVRANSELLLRHLDATVESRLDQVEAITLETEHMTHLVEDLLTLARADEGAANLALGTEDLGAIVEEVGHELGALAELHGVRLAVETSPAVVAGDRQRLRQLAVILIDNALKYTPEGGRVAVRCRVVRKHAEFSITDSGPGIPAKDHDRIFDRFVRLDSSRTRSAGGSGLGLAIAQSIAQAHGGRINVESQAGHGATFVVRLPLQ